MKLPTNDKPFEIAPAGNHLAICIRFIDLGTQTVDYHGDIKHQRKVLIVWELPHETMSEGLPFVVSQRYTWSTDDRSNLRRDLESWRGKRFTDSDFGADGFDIRNILGKACMLQVAHRESGGKVYANVQAVTSLPRDTAILPQANSSVYFGMDDQFDWSVYESLSDRIRDEIAKSPEYVSWLATTPEPHRSECEIPF